jgi:hypothetical protein
VRVAVSGHVFAYPYAPAPRNPKLLTVNGACACIPTYTHTPKPETAPTPRNPKPKTQNPSPKPETRNLKSETQSPKPETLIRKPETLS